MCHLRQKLKIFSFCRKIMFRFQVIQVFCNFNHLMIYQICDVMMSTGDKVYVGIYYLNQSSLSHQTWPIVWYKPEQTFSGIFWKIWRIGAMFQVLFNLATCSTYVKIPEFHFFEKLDKGHLKMVSLNY